MDETFNHNPLGYHVIRALGLPRFTTRLEIVFEGKNPPRVRCEYLLFEPGMTDAEIIKELEGQELLQKSVSEYELHQREEPQP